MLMRIRTVKPQFFKHRPLYELEQRTGLPIRVAYVGLWGVCDRMGRFEWKPDSIKLDVIPYDDCRMQDVLAALVADLYVVQYIVGGRAYGWCPTMPVHQAINARESASTVPPTPRAVVNWYQSAMLAQNMGQPFSEPNPLQDPPATEQRQQSTNGARSATASISNDLQDSSRVGHASVTRQAPMGHGSGTGADAPSLPVSDGGIEAQPEETAKDSLHAQTERARADAGRTGEHAGSLVPAGGAQQALPAIRGKRNVDAIVQRLGQALVEVVEGSRPPLAREQWRRVAAELVFAYWAKSYGKEGSFLTENDKREQRINQRLKENGDDVGELLYALDGAKRNKFLMGDNEQRMVYDGLETLLRDRAQVEKLSALIPAFRQQVVHPMVQKYAAVLVGLGAPDTLRERLQRDDSSNGNHAPGAE